MASIKRLQPGARMSEGTVHNGVVYLAGQVAVSGATGIKEQVREVLGSIDALLTEAGSHKSNILRAQIFLADLADFPALNELWDAWVVPGSTPARATVQAKLAKPEWKVEIVVTAAVG
jgi:enamine deaminase RidA (YjgF/YER057c/UK114 family)